MSKTPQIKSQILQNKIDFFSQNKENISPSIKNSNFYSNKNSNKTSNSNKNQPKNNKIKINIKNIFQKKKLNSDFIQTFCRIRPNENNNNCIKNFDISENDTKLTVKFLDGNCYLYNFSKIFGPNKKNTEIFNFICKDFLNDFINFNKSGLIFVYGFSNSGKSFTIEGDENNKGILQLSFKEIFNLLQNKNNFELNSTFIEIYNESIFDLLSENRNKLKLTYKNNFFQIKNPIIHNIKNENDFLNTFNIGIKNRTIHSTNLNQNSSRSHIIFRIEFKINNNLSSISFVDLAGVERQNRANTKGENLKEAGNINKSLLVLRNCIEIMEINTQNSLVDKKVRVPIRESKLTMIFKEYFMNDKNIKIIANINPALDDMFDNKNVLNFITKASKVKPIKSWIEEIKNNKNNKKVFHMFTTKKNKKINNNNNECSNESSVIDSSSDFDSEMEFNANVNNNNNNHSILKERNFNSKNKNLGYSKSNSNFKYNSNYNYKIKTNSNKKCNEFLINSDRKNYNNNVNYFSGKKKDFSHKKNEKKNAFNNSKNKNNNNNNNNKNNINVIINKDNNNNNNITYENNILINENNNNIIKDEINNQINNNENNNNENNINKNNNENNNIQINNENNNNQINNENNNIQINNENNNENNNNEKNNENNNNENNNNENYIENNNNNNIEMKDFTISHSTTEKINIIPIKNNIESNLNNNNNNNNTTNEIILNEPILNNIKEIQTLQNDYKTYINNHKIYSELWSNYTKNIKEDLNKIVEKSENNGISIKNPFYKIYKEDENEFLKNINQISFEIKPENKKSLKKIKENFSIISKINNKKKKKKNEFRICLSEVEIEILNENNKKKKKNNKKIFNDEDDKNLTEENENKKKNKKNNNNFDLSSSEEKNEENEEKKTKNNKKNKKNNKKNKFDDDEDENNENSSENNKKRKKSKKNKTKSRNKKNNKNSENDDSLNSDNNNDSFEYKKKTKKSKKRKK